MKYETPQMTALTPAINVIQSTPNKAPHMFVDTWDPGDLLTEVIGAYIDWE
jgi:hypothetical protein